MEEKNDKRKKERDEDETAQRSELDLRRSSFARSKAGARSLKEQGARRSAGGIWLFLL